MMLAHIMGIPVEESVLQLAPASAAMVTAVAIAGRANLRRLRRLFSGYGVRARVVQRSAERGAYRAPCAGRVVRGEQIADVERGAAAFGGQLQPRLHCLGALDQRFDVGELSLGQFPQLRRRFRRDRLRRAAA
jgi:hypothetical protein